MSSLRSLLKSGRISKTKPKSKSASPRKHSSTTTPDASPEKQPPSSNLTPPTTPSRSRSSNSSKKFAATRRQDDEEEDKVAKNHGAAAADDDDEDLFQDQLDDVGLVAALATDLSLRDVPQAMAHARSRMFSPLPASAASGMSSARIAQVLHYRERNLPPLVTVGHVHAVLSASPSAVEREVAELEGRGLLRRIRVGRARRGGGGEALMRAAELEGLVARAEELGGQTKSWFLRFLRENPREGVLGKGTECERRVADELVRGGFLTGRAGAAAQAAPARTTGGAASASASSYGRPEDRGSMTSLQAVSRAPSGSVAAVGGSGAVLLAGGGGGAPRSSGSGSGSGYGSRPSGASALDHDYSVAVPGQGPFFKLVDGSVGHLVSFLDKTRFGEMPEDMLRERWEGGVASDEARKARKARGHFAGVLPGRTRKWKEIWGVEFAWVLEEAVGMGAVEVFETGSVGRAVRKL